MAELQEWDLWFPDAGATGMSFARGKVAGADVMWAHAAPNTLSVTVRQGDKVVAHGENLLRQGEYLPTTRLWLEGATVMREDRFPAGADLGALIILPGGEVGTLLQWWNAPDGSEWRWQIELYNHK